MAAIDGDDEPFEGQFSIDYDEVNRIEFFLFKLVFYSRLFRKKQNNVPKKTIVCIIK